MQNLYRCIVLFALALLRYGGLRQRLPTSQRVLYVEECMREHPGPHYEMVNKCSCALDTLAQEVKYEDYVGMSTVVNAMSIAASAAAPCATTKRSSPRSSAIASCRPRFKKACFINDIK